MWLLIQWEGKTTGQRRHLPMGRKSEAKQRNTIGQNKTGQLQTALACLVVFRVKCQKSPLEMLRQVRGRPYFIPDFLQILCVPASRVSVRPSGSRTWAVRLAGTVNW